MDLKYLKKHIMWNYVKDVIQITDPVNNELNLNYFDYAKFYPDGRCIILSSDKDWTLYFLSDLAYQNNMPVNSIEAGLHLWEEYIHPKFIEIAKDKFNHINGITLQINNPTHTEIFNFAAAPGNQKILSLYLNNKEFLYQFGVYFKEKASKIITTLEKQPLIIRPSNTTSINSIDVSKISSIFNSEVKTLDNGNPIACLNKRLTPKENECLKLLLKGNTSKKIAKQMNISFRTVEKHIDSIREKLGCRNRLELVTLIIGKKT